MPWTYWRFFSLFSPVSYGWCAEEHHYPIPGEVLSHYSARYHLTYCYGYDPGVVSYYGLVNFSRYLYNRQMGHRYYLNCYFYFYFLLHPTLMDPFVLKDPVTLTNFAASKGRVASMDRVFWMNLAAWMDHVALRDLDASMKFSARICLVILRVRVTLTDLDALMKFSARICLVYLRDHVTLTDLAPSTNLATSKDHFVLTDHATLMSRDTLTNFAARMDRLVLMELAILTCLLMKALSI